MPRWFMLDVAFSIWSPLMIDGPNRYANLWSVEQVTRGRVGSSLPARMSFLSHWVAWNCKARYWMPWRVLCRHFFSSAMRPARSVRGSGAVGCSGGGAGLAGALLAGAGPPGAGGVGLGAGLGAGPGVGGGSWGYGRGWGAGLPVGAGGA